MKIKLLAVGVLAAMCQAQTPIMTLSVPAGAIYQAAVANGIDYINPTTGQDILNKRASLNWKTVAGQVASEGSIGVITGGLSGIFHITTGALIGLSVGHSYYDRSIAPIIAGAAPSPSAIAPVLQMGGSMAPSATACVENSLYASSVSNISAKMMLSKKRKATAPTPIANPVFAMVGGLSISFSPQGVGVLRDLSGATIDQFMVIDVLACVPQVTNVTTPAAMVMPTTIHVNPDAIDKGFTERPITISMDAPIAKAAELASIHVDASPADPTMPSSPVQSVQLPQSFNNGIDKQIHETLERITRFPDMPSVTVPFYKPVAVSFSQPVSDPKTAEILNQKGRALIAAGNYSAAVVQLQKAVSLDQYNKQAFNALGFGLHLIHNDTDAVVAYNRAIQLDSNYKNAIVNRSVSLKALASKKEII